MKLSKNIFAKNMLAVFAAALVLYASADVKAQANLIKAIDAHINKVREEASEYKKVRKIIYGDMDGDGSKDAVVQYTLEGFGGGNSWGQNLAVFLNKKGVYKFAADETVGGKFFRSFIVLGVENKTIIGKTETCPDEEPQGICQNPAKKNVKFVLTKGRLVEK